MIYYVYLLAFALARRALPLLGFIRMMGRINGIA